MMKNTFFRTELLSVFCGFGKWNYAVLVPPIQCYYWLCTPYNSLYYYIH